MAQDDKPGPSGGPKSPPPADKKKSAQAAAAAEPPAKPTFAEHYFGKTFVANVKKAFTGVEPFLVVLLVAFCVSQLYPCDAPQSRPGPLVVAVVCSPFLRFA